MNASDIDQTVKLLEVAIQNIKAITVSFSRAFKTDQNVKKDFESYCAKNLSNDFEVF